MTLETDAALNKRVVSFLQETAKKYPDASILLVTHGGVMRNILAMQLGIPLSGIHVENMALLQLKVADDLMQIGEMHGVQVP